VRRRLAAVLAAAVAAGAGCSGSEDSTSIRLVVPDKNIRVEGVECAGARPFEQVHAGARYAIEETDGTVVAEGTLPAGHAENAEPEIDWEVERIPTFCVLELDAELDKGGRYRFTLDGARPIAFVAGDEPVVLVVA
jgi:hypothetical protein